MENKLVKKEETVITYGSGQNIKELFGDELEGMDLRFDRIKIPSGGGLVFEMPSDNPENPDILKEFKAVIVYHHIMGSYYSEKFNGGNQLPECSSIDGKIGTDHKTGEIKDCLECPYNVYGSGENGGKACKKKRRIFLLREKELLPTILNIPTASLIDFNSYIQRLMKKGKKSCCVVTKFSLKKSKNKKGVIYSRVVCCIDRDLNQKEQQSIISMAKQIKEYAGKVTEPVNED